LYGARPPSGGRERPCPGAARPCPRAIDAAIGGRRERYLRVARSWTVAYNVRTATLGSAAGTTAGAVAEGKVSLSLTSALLGDVVAAWGKISGVPVEVGARLLQRTVNLTAADLPLPQVLDRLAVTAGAVRPGGQHALGRGSAGLELFLHRLGIDQGRQLQAAVAYGEGHRVPVAHLAGQQGGDPADPTPSRD